MEDTTIDILYLNEDDMIEAGVLDAGKCVDTMEEMMGLLSLSLIHICFAKRERVPNNNATQAESPL